MTSPHDRTHDQFRLAESYLDAGDPREALAILDEVADELTGSAAALLLRARAYYRTAQLGRAEQVLRELLVLDPVDHYAHFLLGRTLERANRRDEAASCYRLATAMPPEPAYREQLAALAG